MKNTNINKNGGTVIQGNVNTGRDFIGRDKIENHIYTQPKVDPAELLNRGLQQFSAKAYQQAATTLKEVIKADPSVRAAYYYLALALLKGQRPKVISRSEIFEIDEVLATAIGLNNTDGLFHWFRALLRDDYFTSNRINCPSPSVNEVVSSARFSQTDITELKMLLQELSMPNNRLYTELVRQLF